ncbi:uncharacterized protein LOC107615631 [Arachis ipaensis]|uniref:uncharacterized protein LOC107615631 n=1 Tax=Arachis ipaensis TaxID=130454 RepID=UPI0007AF129B|nr:uncharacterized protein LOC107615631 [Arachis ipaensis]
MVTRVRGRGRGRDRASNLEPETTENNPAKFMTTLENMAAAMRATAVILGNQAGNGNGDDRGNGPTTLASFLKINPPIFRGTTNPTEADNWFQAMEWALQAQQVPESQCVEFATYQLTVRTDKELELLQRKQGQMSEAKYTNKFEELYRFSKICQGAPGDFEEWKCIKYEGGVRSDILSLVGPMEIRVFSDLVNKSRVMENCLRKAAMERNDSRDFHRRDHNQNLAPIGQEFKRRGKQTRDTTEELTCQKCGHCHPDRPWRFGLGVCYKRGLPGHVSRNCPQGKTHDGGRSNQQD